jgi:multiple sugar transport system permease protein
MVYAFYRQVLRTEILDAAAIDGATTLQKFRYTAVPLARPAVAALAALVFVWSFGDLLFAVTFLQDSSKWTVPIAAATLVSRQNITAQAQAAAALVALAPSLLVVLFAQRALVRGFGGGSAD